MRLTFLFTKPTHFSGDDLSGFIRAVLFAAGAGLIFSAQLFEQAQNVVHLASPV
jgi:hypothetical protein